MMAGLRVLLLLLPLCLWVVEAMKKDPPPEVKDYPAFGRDCSKGGDRDCEFVGGGDGGDKIYLACKPATLETFKGQKYCVCGTGNPPQDVLMWPLEWDPSVAKCLVGKGSPCGVDKGLTLNCKDKLACVEGRCREPDNLHSADVHTFCNDHLDCKEGLVCGDSATPTFVRIKRCYPPT